MVFKIGVAKPTLLKRGSNTVVFLFKFWKLFKNTFFYRTLPVAGSVVFLVTEYNLPQLLKSFLGL